jgi:hypothetical protein
MNKLPDTTDECLVQIEYESGKKIYLLANRYRLQMDRL